jgi:hypothetical protein
LGKSVISQFADFGGKGLTFTGGGEPLLNKDLSRFLEHSQQSGLDNGLITNGRTLTQKLARKIIPFLRWLRVSIYTDNAPQVWQNIAKAQSLAAQLNPGLYLSASYLVFEDDPKAFQQAADLAQQSGISLQFKPGRVAAPELSCGTKYELDKLLKAKDSIDSLKTTHPHGPHIAITRFAELLERNYHLCYGQQWTTALGADGLLYLCCEHKYDPRFLLGDLRTSTFQEIWESTHRREVLKIIITWFSCFPGCKLHEINNALASKTVAQLLEEHRDVLAPFPNFI